MMWRTPETLVEIGFSRSRVVMINEFHNGLLRCPWMREVGRRIIPVAHAAGVRHLALEALYPAAMAEEANRTRWLPHSSGGYLSQPDMRVFIQDALDLGWTVIAYEADIEELIRSKTGIAVDFNAPLDEETIRKLESIREYAMSLEVTNWREEAQADHLLQSLESLPADAKLLVWCGGTHHSKTIRETVVKGEAERWIPMGYHFRQKSGLDPFTIHQMILLDPDGRDATAQVLGEFVAELERFGGRAGYLREEAPHPVFREIMPDQEGDAFIFSTQNMLI